MFFLLFFSSSHSFQTHANTHTHTLIVAMARCCRACIENKFKTFLHACRFSPRLQGVFFRCFRGTLHSAFFLPFRILPNQTFTAKRRFNPFLRAQEYGKGRSNAKTKWREECFCLSADSLNGSKSSPTRYTI